MDYMDGDSKKKLKKSIQVLEELFSALEENKIKIDDLLIVLKYSENLTNIADQIQKIPQFRMPLTPDTLAVILECRTKDMKTLKDAITIVESLDEILKQVRYCEYTIIHCPNEKQFFKQKSCPSLKIIKGTTFKCSSVYQEYDLENTVINKKVLITFNSYFEYHAKGKKKKLPKV